MAKTESLKVTLQSCVSEEWFLETASTTGLVKRRSKVDIVAFFWTLVLGFGTGMRDSLGAGNAAIIQSLKDNDVLVVALSESLLSSCTGPTLGAGKTPGHMGQRIQSWSHSSLSPGRS